MSSNLSQRQGRWDATKKSATDTHTNKDAFRVVSYNILHSGYLADKDSASAIEIAKYADPSDLETPYRCQLIARELEAYNADILLLQEFGDDNGTDGKQYVGLRKALEKRSFKCEFFKKTGVSTEGILIAFNTKRFVAVQAKKLISLSAHRVSDGNSGITNPRVLKKEELVTLEKASSVLGICVLQDTKNPKNILVVGNTHLYSNPDAHDARGIQALMVCHALAEVCQNANDFLAKQSAKAAGKSVAQLATPLNELLVSSLKAVDRHRLSKLQERTIPYLLEGTNVLRVGGSDDCNDGYLSAVIPLMSKIASLVCGEDDDSDEEEEEASVVPLSGFVLVDESFHAGIKNLLCRIITQLNEQAAKVGKRLPTISVCSLSDSTLSQDDIPNHTIVIGTPTQVTNICYEGVVKSGTSLLFVASFISGEGDAVVCESGNAVKEIRKICDDFTLLVDIGSMQSFALATKEFFAGDETALCIRDDDAIAPKFLKNKRPVPEYSANYDSEEDDSDEDDKAEGGVYAVLGGDFNCTPEQQAYTAVINGVFDSRKPAFNKPLLRFADAHDGAKDRRYTTITQSYSEIVDYIFFGSGNKNSLVNDLALVSTLPMPAEDEVAGAIPNSLFPSDHIAVVADLSF